MKILNYHFFKKILTIFLFAIYSNQSIAENIINKNCNSFRDKEKIANFIQKQTAINLKISGCSKLSFFGKEIYDIALYVENSQFKQFNQHFALVINYKSSATKDFLTKISIKEIRRIHPEISDEEIDKIKTILLKNLVTITEGDTKIAIFYPKQYRNNNYLDFFHNYKKVGNIENKQFAIYFLDIWLNQKTKFPQMRKEIIGENN